MFDSCPKATLSTELWCAHLPGDDVIPTVDSAEATKIADRINGALQCINERNPSPHNVEATGHVCPWPWSAKSHREDAMTFASWEERERAEWS